MLNLAKKLKELAKAHGAVIEKLDPQIQKQIKNRSRIWVPEQ